MKKVLILLFLTFGLALTGCSLTVNRNQPVVNNQPINQAVEADVSRPNELEPTVETEESAEVGIKNTAMKKFNFKSEDFSIVISKQNGNFVQGGVKMTDPNTPGGWLYATKVAGVWQIVQSGNGGPDCAVLNQYKFPREVLGTDCSEPTPTEGVKAAVIKKFGLKSEEFSITIRDEMNGYISGGVKMTKIDTPGFWLYAKRTADLNVWEIVDSGNGDPDCNLLKQKGFPSYILDKDCPKN